MSSPSSRSPHEWPAPDQPLPPGKRFLRHRLAGLAAVFLFGFFIYASNGAPWMKRLTMCMLFCGLIYVRDDSPRGRWVAIGIITAGTLLAMLLPWFGFDADLLRRHF
jgi:hypothetical protein